jgi:hypothetical protein
VSHNIACFTIAYFVAPVTKFPASLDVRRMTKIFTFLVGQSGDFAPVLRQPVKKMSHKHAIGGRVET